MKKTYILGISGAITSSTQDSAAVLLCNDEIVAAVEEERLVRLKHARGLFPKKAIAFCLEYAGIGIKDVDRLAYHLQSYPSLEQDVRQIMHFHFGYCPRIHLIDHHLAHAASAYLISGFDEAAIITMDYSGDGISTTLNAGQKDDINVLQQYRKPNSLGIYYAMMTQFLGFSMDADEYKVMGLSSYGRARETLMKKMEHVLHAGKAAYRLNKRFFASTVSRQQPRFTKALEKLLGPPRFSNQPVTDREKDLAKAAQQQFERACDVIVEEVVRRTKSRNLCLAGGAALNCVMNGRIVQSSLVDNMYIPPAPGDNGTAMGAALFVANRLGFRYERLKNPFLGPSFSDAEIRQDLILTKMSYRRMKEDALLQFIAKSIMTGNIVGWFQDRLEFGPRALGNRSILADPSNPHMRDLLNKKIKFREDFRPFAPSVCEEDAEKYFERVSPSPYMSFTFMVKSERLPAVTHVDGSARVQTVSQKENPLYYKLLKIIKQQSGIPVVLNTSLNIMDQPIVCTPKEAISVFASTGMDMLVLGNYVLEKSR